MTEFGNNLRQLLKENKLSVKEFAEKLDMPIKTVTEWSAKGRLPRDLNVIKKIASILNWSTHRVLFGEEDPKGLIEESLNNLEIHTGLYQISVKRIKQN